VGCAILYHAENDLIKMKLLAIPKLNERIEHSWYKDIATKCKRNRNKAVFVSSSEVKSAYFVDAVRRAGRRLGIKLKVAYSPKGWFVWIDRVKKYET
jgi:argonaute-like protein implicated in RNA metabolism and viral defense